MLGVSECPPNLGRVSDDINAVGIAPGSLPHGYILPSVSAPFCTMLAVDHALTVTVLPVTRRRRCLTFTSSLYLRWPSSFISRWRWAGRGAATRLPHRRRRETR